MNLHEEIAKKAFELYEKGGCIKGMDCENWLEAERIVLARHASQDIEEPDEMGAGEESMVGRPFRAEEMRETEAGPPPITRGSAEESAESVGTEEFVAGPPASTAEETVVPPKTKGRREKKIGTAGRSAVNTGKGSASGRKSRTR